MPSTFKLAGMDFKVQLVDFIKDGTEYGEYSDATNTINVTRKIKEDGVIIDLNYNTFLNTFLHELIHIFQYYYNNEYNEAQAQVFANFLMEFIQTKNGTIYDNSVNNQS